MIDNKKLYLSGPIDGCTDEECFGWRNHFKKIWPGKTLDPTIRDFRGLNHDFKYIVEMDKFDIQHADGLVVNFSKHSAGTPMEIMYAWSLGKPIAIWNSSDEQLSPWHIYHSHFQCEYIEKAAEWFENFFQNLEG